MSKIPLLIGLGLSTISFATWSGFAFKDNQEYNSRMNKYQKWRDEFFNKQDPSIKDQICNFQNDCTKDKGYFPTPYENELWQKAYENLTTNLSNKKRLPDINGLENLKDYCYESIRKDLLGLEDPNHEDFNPSGSTSHDLCVLSGSKLNY